MGGNALKNTETRRYMREEYFDLEVEVLEKLKPYALEMSNIVAYSEKESFGDMDILYVPFSNNNILESVKNVFKPNEIVPNGNVISFDYKGLQIDLIKSSLFTFEYSKFYFGFNDLGNLIGKIAHRFGLKHGHDGLFLKVMDGDQHVDDLLLTRDPQKTLEFLDLDVKRYTEAFKNLDEIFTYVTSSKYFAPQLFDLDTLRHRDRTRDKKRDTYQKFLKYIEENKFEEKVLPSKFEVVHKVLDYFDREDEFHRTVSAYVLNQTAKSKLRGSFVSELTGFQHKELGDFMKYLRSLPFTRSSVLVLMTEEQIKQHVMRSYLAYPNR